MSRATRQRHFQTSSTGDENESTVTIAIFRSLYARARLHPRTLKNASANSRLYYPSGQNDDIFGRMITDRNGLHSVPLPLHIERDVPCLLVGSFHSLLFNGAIYRYILPCNTLSSDNSDHAVFDF